MFSKKIEFWPCKPIEEPKFPTFNRIEPITFDIKCYFNPPSYDLNSNLPPSYKDVMSKNG